LPLSVTTTGRLKTKRYNSRNVTYIKYTSDWGQCSTATASHI